MKKTIALFLILLLQSAPSWGVVYTQDTATSRYGIGYVRREARGWDDRLNDSINTIERVVSILSDDKLSSDSALTQIISSDVGVLKIRANILSNDAVATWTSPLQYTTATRVSSIQAASTAQAGSMDAAQYTKINILSNDSVTQDTRLTILSNDAVTQDTRITILSNDAVTQDTRITILSNDTVTQDRRLSILSADSNDWGVGFGSPKIQFSILSPDLIALNSGRGDRSAIIWTNESGQTFVISKIEAYSDNANYKFDLLYSTSLTSIALAAQNSADQVFCITAGTGMSYSSDTAITNNTMTTDRHLIFRHDSGTTNWLKCNIYGSF